VFFALILLRQLVDHFLIKKLIFSFCFFTIPGQQGYSKIVTWLGKCIACPHEGRCVFWAGPTMVAFKVDCCRGEFLHRRVLYFSLQRKSTIHSETFVSEWHYWVSPFYGNSIRFLLLVISINKNRNVSL